MMDVPFVKVFSFVNIARFSKLGGMVMTCLFLKYGNYSYIDGVINELNDAPVHEVGSKTQFFNVGFTILDKHR